MLTRFKLASLLPASHLSSEVPELEGDRAAAEDEGAAEVVITRGRTRLSTLRLPVTAKAHRLGAFRGAEGATEA